MVARWRHVFIWTLAFGSALPWAYVLTRPSKVATAAAPAASLAATAPTDLTRLLGADPPPTEVTSEAAPVADTRMQLIGVVSPLLPGDAKQGLALIALDGQLPKVYRVGMVVDGDTVLQAVEARGAKLGPRGGAPLIALSSTPVDSVATAERQPPAAPMAAALPPRLAPRGVPPPMPAPAPAADGTPAPFGGPPPALGGAPPAPPNGLPRRADSF